MLATITVQSQEASEKKAVVQAEEAEATVKAGDAKAIKVTGRLLTDD